MIVIGVPLVGWMMRLYSHFKHARTEEVAKAKRETLLKRAAIILLTILLILLVLIAALRVMVELKAFALGMVGIAAAEIPVDENGFTNVLLLGVGGDKHDGVDLTDTVMIASMDPKRTKSAVLLSVPRDTYILKTEKMGVGRINSLYRDYKSFLIRSGQSPTEASIDALSQLASELSIIFGLPIHGTVKVDFDGFEQAVDLIGGIDVVLPKNFVDTEYPGPNYSYITFSLPAGTQHLDGATALKYARSRHSTSDFSRSERQQQILSAIAKKMKEDGIIKSPSKIMDMLNIVSKNVESTFTTRELLGLAEHGKNIETNRIVTMQLNDQNGLYGGLVAPGGFLYAPPREEFEGAAVLLPVSIPPLPVTWKQIQALTALLFLQREAFLLPPSIHVLNAGGAEGAARKLGGELYRYGFLIDRTGNYAPRDAEFETSFIAVNPALKDGGDLTKDAFDRAQFSASLLASILGMPVLPLPNAQPVTDASSPDILIVLGEDFTYTALQDNL